RLRRDRRRAPGPLAASPSRASQRRRANSVARPRRRPRRRRSRQQRRLLGAGGGAVPRRARPRGRRPRDRVPRTRAAGRGEPDPRRWGDVGGGGKRDDPRLDRRGAGAGQRLISPRMLAAEEALHGLAGQLRRDDSVISPHVSDPGEAEPSLGLLAASGPRASAAPGEYSLMIESIREGYLLHYGRPRVVAGADGDLALLAG